MEDNKIRIHYPEEERELYIKKILTYLHYSDSLYYYLYFGYSDGNVAMNQYYEEYPELLEDKGFIKLKGDDINNWKLVYDLLYNYQFASLYINKNADIDKKYSYIDIRDDNFLSLFEGYVILVLNEDSIVIEKDYKLPDWDLEKMGVSEDMVY